MQPRPPLPPFTEETANAKVKAAEDAWNTRDPERVAGAYTEDSVWRNRGEFITVRSAYWRRCLRRIRRIVSTPPTARDGHPASQSRSERSVDASVPPSAARGLSAHSTARRPRLRARAPQRSVSSK